MSTRYVVLGAGAVGATLGGRLAEAGHDVVLVARGEHARVMARDGLRLAMPDRVATVPVTVAEDPGSLTLTPHDVLVLACKTQDSAALLDAAAAAAGWGDQLVVCAQNGVANERLALRRTARVAGMCVMLPATHLEPGRVDAQGTPYSGKLEIGRYPDGDDPGASRLVDDLNGSGFVATARQQVMPWKYAKLLRNTGNAIQALCGDDRDDDDVRELDRMVSDEARRVLDGAGVDVVSDEQWQRHRGDDVRIGEVAGRARSGGSTWQSLTRGLPAETDYLNGEIVLTARLHGLVAPVNELLQREVATLVRRRGRPGDVTAADLLARARTAADGAGA